MSNDQDSSQPAPVLYLLDGTAYMYRAFHAVRGLSNSKGLPTNAVFGFTRMLISFMEEKKPAYAAMFFDSKGPTFRHEIYDHYKANRPPMPVDMVAQIPHIREVTAGFNLPIFEQQGFEADDLIGTLARLAEEAGFEVVMVTGDKDFMQLVTEKATIWDPMKDKTIDRAAVLDQVGVEPNRVIEVMGLSGDSADNVPGVPGIGPKTARTLIQNFGDMDKLYAEVDSITKKKQHENLVNFKEQAFLSRTLVTIKTDIPLEFSTELFRLKSPDNKRLAELFGKMEFGQLQQSYLQEADRKEKKYHAVTDPDDLSNLVERLASAPLIALDTETTAVDPMQAELVGISLALEPDEAYYIPLHHNYPGVPQQIKFDTVLAQLGPILANPAVKKIGQNIKYDWIVLQRHGFTLAGVAGDTMLASYLLNPSKRSHGLDQIARDLLGHKTISYQDVAGKGAAQVTFERVPLEKAVPYACEDADITLAAYQVLMPRIETVGLAELMQTVELPLVPVLMEMEMTGICVDKERLGELSQDLARQLDQLVEQIYALAGEQFNVNSSQQLGRILFEKLELPVQKKTKKKTAYSTDVKVLTTLAEKHEMPALILRHRTLAKLKSTYADALLDLVNPQTRRIHTSYNQTVAATGRLSSSDPNLQNIPIRTAEGRQIRETFVPRPGWQFLGADYSQIELRILAHYADDPILIKAFREGEDIHTRTATEVFQVFPEFIDDDLRRQAKVINFGIIYGMSAFRLSKELGISNKMAKSYIDNYFARYEGVKRFIDRTIETARETQKTSTLLGRIRLLPDINSSNRTVRQFAERTAVNTPIQGTAADLIKVAMIDMHKALEANSLEAAMLLSVHDELVFEAPPDELETLERLVKEVMENVWELKVPLEINVVRGANWSEAH